VIGVDHDGKRASICEVVTHLTTGIQYVNTKTSKPDTADRLIKKFMKDTAYGKRAFRDYVVSYMLWSPVVHHTQGAQYDQFAHLEEICVEIKKTEIEIEVVVNEHYLEAIAALRAFASKETKELKSPIKRFLQIEQWANKNYKNIVKKGKIAPVVTLT
jgi:hypothetical protein